METKSFYSLISKHVIEVPIIQREYAQGRTSERVTTIRKRFVKDLIKCINHNETMHLGFIYGKIEGKDKQRTKQINRDAVNSILQAVKAYAGTLELQIDPNIKENVDEVNQYTQLKFIPLDGQQRLTTLYLLHWYLYLKGAQTSEIFWTHNFNYTNRKSTMDFLKVINEIDNFKVIQERISKGLGIKSVIKDASFYLQKWNKDKTVVGLLEMLQSIESEINQDEKFSCPSLNLDSLKFQFDFMDLDALNQTNELYVKMNSRGKQLTNYEHFKSWLQNQHSDADDKEWLDEFWRNLDNKWLNFFWRKLNADFNKLDDFFFNFLKNIALMQAIASNPQIPLESFKELIELVRNDKTYNSDKVAYVSFDKFFVKWKSKKVDDELVSDEENVLFIFNKEILQFIEKSFVTLMDANSKSLSFLDNLICKPFFDKRITSLFFANTEFTPSQPDTVFFYAFISLLNKHSDASDEDLKVWLRITRNLIYNTPIQGFKDFYKALQQINYHLEHFLSFKQNLLDDKVENSFFDSNQYKEEILKTQLINIDRNWYNPLTETENQFYFQGQIKFLVDFSKQKNDEYNLDLFLKFSKASSILFGNSIRNSSLNVLQRAILCKGFYLPYRSRNRLFCMPKAGDLRTRNENWRLFFEGENVDLLNKLIEELDVIDITEKSLISYIEKHLENSSYQKWNWEFLFLKYPKAISYCKQSFVKWHSDNDIRLLPGINIGGNHAELRSYCFYLEHKLSDETVKPTFIPFKKFTYFPQQNTDAHPGCRLNGFSFKKKFYRLDIRYSKEDPIFELSFYHEVVFEDRKTDNQIIEILENQTFTFNSAHNHYYREVVYSETNKEIENLCLALKKLI